MTMLHTIQTGYEPLQPGPITNVIGQALGADGTVGLLDGSTTGFTYDYTVLRPETTIKNGYDTKPDQNGVVIRVEAYDVCNDSTLGIKLWGYTARGPAEHIADVSCVVGTANIADSTSNLHVDTMTVTSDTHVKSVSAFDSGNDRIAKVFFDAAGYDVIYCEFEDISNANQASACGSVQAYIRGF